jgi:hypothetical protein
VVVTYVLIFKIKALRAATLEDRLAISSKTVLDLSKKTEKQLLISSKTKRILPYDSAVTLFPSEWKTCPHNILHVVVDNSFIHNGQKLEATNMSFTT